MQETGPPRLVMIGATGTGKSSTCNSIAGRTVFEASPPGVLTSQTNTTDGVNITFKNGSTRTPLTLIDTPGLGDSEGRDTLHIAAMIDSLQKDWLYVNAFIICFNSNLRRIDQPLKNMLTIFGQCFGSDYVKNMVVVLTHWRMRACDIEDREDEGITERKIARGYNEILKKAVGYRGPDFPVIFVNNKPSKRDQGEQQATRVAVAKLVEHARRMPRYECKDMQKVKDLLDQKEDELREKEDELREKDQELGQKKRQIDSLQKQVDKTKFSKDAKKKYTRLKNKDYCTSNFAVRSKDSSSSLRFWISEGRQVGKAFGAVFSFGIAAGSIKMMGTFVHCSDPAVLRKFTSKYNINGEIDSAGIYKVIQKGAEDGEFRCSKIDKIEIKGDIGHYLRIYLETFKQAYPQHF